MKPILFNYKMVRAILEGRKTVTRRTVRLKYRNTHLEIRTDKYGTRLIEIQNEEPGVTTVKNQDGTTTHRLLAAEEKAPPYRPGDILWVREAWRCVMANSMRICDIEYKAGGVQTFHEIYALPDKPGKWRPSIHMPREAARLFLRVIDVRVERLQDMRLTDCEKEGVQLNFIEEADLVNRGVRARKRFAEVWDSTIKPADRSLYGWEANPWVWVIEFERVSKEEALKNDGR